MPIARQTFVVQMHDEDGTAMLENVRTQECVRIDDLAAIGKQIERWLERDREVTHEDDDAFAAGGRRAGTGRVRRR